MVDVMHDHGTTQAASEGSDGMSVMAKEGSSDAVSPVSADKEEAANSS
jgi:hypothetical protein